MPALAAPVTVARGSALYALRPALFQETFAAHDGCATAARGVDEGIVAVAHTIYIVLAKNRPSFRRAPRLAENCELRPHQRRQRAAAPGNAAGERECRNRSRP